MLDHLLFRAAERAGAAVRPRCSVSDVLWEDGRVVGVRGRLPSGGQFSERARLVVGADGSRSRIARAVGASIDWEEPDSTCSYYTFYEGSNADAATANLWGMDGYGCGAVPTHDGLTMVAANWRKDRADDVRVDLDGAFEELVRLVPTLGKMLEGAQRVERIKGMRSIPNVIRRSHGPGWALVGDAGYTKDPITAQGITDAFQSAELLSEAIDAGLTGREPLAEALADYQRRRDEAAAPYFRWTVRVASLQPLSERARPLFEAIAADPDQAPRFFGINAKITDPEAFFSEDNVGRILGGKRHRSGEQ